MTKRKVVGVSLASLLAMVLASTLVAPAAAAWATPVPASAPAAAAWAEPATAVAPAAAGWAEPATAVAPAAAGWATPVGAGTPVGTVAPGAPTTPSEAQAAQTYSGPAVVAQKQEVVYVNLNADGSISHASVVNHFAVEKAGIVTDTGAYSEVTNLTSTEDIELAGTTVSVGADAGDFYYQGELAAPELPWIISLSYKLNGKSVTAAELAGANGTLVLELNTKRNPKVSDSSFFDNYMLQATITLNNAHASGVLAPDATLAGQGDSTIATFMVLPGKEGSFTLEAKVTDFVMDGIQIAGLPLSLAFDLPDTDSMVDDMGSLVDAIALLDEGVAKLNDGVGELNSGSTQIIGGSQQMADGLGALSASSPQIVSASAQIDAALAAIAAQVESGLGGLDLSQLSQLPDGLDTLAKSLGASSAGLVQTRDGLLQAQGRMSGALSGFTPVTQLELQALTIAAATGSTGMTSPEVQTLNALIANYTALATANGTWYGPNGNDGVSAGLTQSIGALNQIITGLDTMSYQLSITSASLAAGLGSADLNTQLAQLTGGLTLISQNYHSFHGGLAQYTGGLDTIAQNYGAFHSGLSSFGNGIGSLAGGTDTLASGTGELHQNVADLPTTMQDEIDKMLADYDFGSFEPVSFLSPNNKDVSLVQFVYLTPAVKVVEPPAEEPAAEPEKNFFDRLLDLFR